MRPRVVIIFAGPTQAAPSIQQTQSQASHLPKSAIRALLEADMPEDRVDKRPLTCIPRRCPFHRPLRLKEPSARPPWPAPCAPPDRFPKKVYAWGFLLLAFLPWARSSALLLQGGGVVGFASHPREAALSHCVQENVERYEGIVRRLYPEGPCHVE